MEDLKVLREEIHDLEYSGYKNRFIAELIEKTLSGKYQWSDKVAYSYGLYRKNKFYVSFDPREKNKLWVSIGNDKGGEWNINEEDGILLLEAIETQMREREIRRIKSVFPKSSFKERLIYFLVKLRMRFSW